MTLEELNRRFSEHQNIAVAVAKLILSYIVDVEFSYVFTMFEYYKGDLQTDDINIHKAEFDIWKFMILKIQEVQPPDTIEKTLKMIYSIKFIYQNIYILLQLCTLIPVSIADAERSFSTLKLIKTYLRNRLNDERLSDVAVINIHKDIAQELNIENVVDEFTKSKRRLSFTNEFIGLMQKYPPIF